MGFNSDFLRGHRMMPPAAAPGDQMRERLARAEVAAFPAAMARLVLGRHLKEVRITWENEDGFDAAALSPTAVPVRVDGRAYAEDLGGRWGYQSTSSDGVAVLSAELYASLAQVARDGCAHWNNQPIWDYLAM